jgi:hypothetical protein
VIRNVVIQLGLVGTLLVGFKLPPLSANPQRTLNPNDLNQPLEIPLAVGYGVSISWLGSSEQIKKVWLDNPTFATLSVDGCLQGLNANCRTNQGQVLHLKRIQTLNLPGVIPSQSSLMTVLTSANKLYLFRLTKASVPSTLIFHLTTPPQSHQTTVAPRPIVDWFLVAAIERGIQSGLKAQTLSRGSRLYQQMRQFQQFLQQGMTELEAQRQSGLSLEVIQKLKQLGNYQDPRLLLNSIGKSGE